MDSVPRVEIVPSTDSNAYERPHGRIGRWTFERHTCPSGSGTFTPAETMANLGYSVLNQLQKTPGRSDGASARASPAASVVGKRTAALRGLTPMNAGSSSGGAVVADPSSPGRSSVATPTPSPPKKRYRPAPPAGSALYAPDLQNVKKESESTSQLCGRCGRG